MAVNKYGRKYSLIISRSEEVIKKVEAPSLYKNLYGDPSIGGLSVSESTYFLSQPSIPLIGQDFRVIEERPSVELSNHQLKATIQYEKDTKSSTPQQATITIFNLSEDTQEKIKAEHILQLSAGYVQDEELPLLFVGNIIKKVVEKRGTDILTTLFCADSYTVKKTARHSEQLIHTNTYRQHFERIFEIAALYGIPRGNNLPTSDPKLEKKSLKGWVINGQLIEQIAKIADSVGYIAYTALGRLFIEPRATPYIVGEALEITPSNIKGSLKSVANNSTNFSTEKDKLEGVKFSTFLDGRITTDKFISLVDTTPKGDYVISSLKHILDFEGTKWDTEVECKLSKDLFL